MSIKSTDQLRELLSGVLEKVIEGTISPTQANAVSNITGKFMQTVVLDMKYHQMKDSMPNIKFLSNSQSDINNIENDKNELPKE
jgi:phosphoribosylformimino-5-aminoimidazole carboxamide ribonucleotide (ProFAR) isomerase